MKVIIKTFSIFILFIMVASCATTGGILPEKYNLDNELERIDQIETFRKPEWEEVDNQSILLKISLENYYLLVLRRPINTILPLEIGLSNSFSTITAGSDRITVEGSGITQYYTIERIYKLKGKEQADEIKIRFGKK